MEVDERTMRALIERACVRILDQDHEMLVARPDLRPLVWPEMSRLFIRLRRLTRGSTEMEIAA